MKIYSIIIFSIIFLTGIIYNIARYSFSPDLLFLKEIYFQKEYIFFLPFILLIVIPILNREWQNKYFLIPIIFGISFFALANSLYMIINYILNFPDHFYAFILFGIFNSIIGFLLCYPFGYNLYQKKSWAIYIFNNFLYIFYRFSLHKYWR